MDRTSARQRRTDGRRRRGRALDRRPFGGGRRFSLIRDRSRFRDRLGRWFGRPSGAGFHLGFGLLSLSLRGLEIGHVKPIEAAQLDRHVLIDGAGVRLLLLDA
jgi:hypothetical protein